MDTTQLAQWLSEAQRLFDAMAENNNTEEMSQRLIYYMGYLAGKES